MNSHPRRKKERAGKVAATAQLRKAGLFKGILFVVGIAMAALLFFTTNMLVTKVRDSALSYLTRTVENYRILLLEGNPEVAFETMQGIDFPIVVTDEDGNPKAWRNLDVAQEDQSPEAMAEVRVFVETARKQGNVPLAVEVFEGQTDYFHYGDPKLVKLLQGMSFISALAVALYVLLGYIGFRTIRKAEERSVWVGMARETAHQLGTPLSSLLGWIEVLGGSSSEELRRDAVGSMREDVRRLEKIAVRFSKIGVVEKLHPIDLDDIVRSSVRYMRTRVGSSVTLELTGEELGDVPLQPELIGWVLENLIRNAAQASKGEGTIRIETGKVRDGIHIDVIDSGVGISSRQHELIFRPGYTTKKRGWGLGLSLARRIVQEMHRGRLYVLSSRPGEGTTIRMVLPS